ncbi:hypothetical protein [Chitinolyticbacter meiyuanensis]|nr:hypothetical protein [Chitinolyticbacter meiyuanensis]
MQKPFRGKQDAPGNESAPLPGAASIAESRVARIPQHIVAA